MKKTTVILLFFILATSLHAQVFNTSSTLGKGKFSAGFEPSFLMDGVDEFYLFLHGGVGLTSSVDLGIKLGVLGSETYIGGDVEFQLGKKFSLSVGAHNFYEFGLDGTLLVTFPIAGSFDLYTGLDTDIIFFDDIIVPVWIPVGIDIGINSRMSFLLEAEIRVTDDGYHFFGGGLNFYF